MNWNWEPSRWKRSTKVLLGLATVWPPVYMLLFVLTIFSFMMLVPFAERSNQRFEDIDLIQLDRKIMNGELKQLTIKPSEIIAFDRTDREYHVWVSNKSTREEILREARELDSRGRQRVDKIDEESAGASVSPLFPIGIVVLFCAHMITILLTMGLMPLYIILTVKSERHDQTARIIWVVLICMLGMFAMPIYWYLYVWRDAPPPATVTGPGNIEDLSPL